MATFTEEWIITNNDGDKVEFINFANVVRVKFFEVEEENSIKGEREEVAVLELIDGTEALIEKGTVKRLKERIQRNLLNS